MSTYLIGDVRLPPGYVPPSGLLAPPPPCPNPIDVTRLDRAEREYACGCGRGCFDPAPEPPTCVCGDRGTHRPEPGIGCTRLGCLCLEPGEPGPRAVQRPPDPRVVTRR